MRLEPRVAGESGHYVPHVPERTLRADDSFWASPFNCDMGAAPGWIAYEFSAPAAVAHVGVRGDGSRRTPKDMVLQGGDAAAGPWDDALRFTSVNNADMQEFALAGVPRARRFWRLLMKTNHGTTNPDNWKFVFREVAFFGALTDV